MIATGPLTSAPLAEAIRAVSGQDSLYFFDAMAPIVTAESVDMEIAWRGNRWDKGVEERRSEGAGRKGVGARFARSAEFGRSARMTFRPSSFVLRPPSATTSTVLSLATSTSRSWRR